MEPEPIILINNPHYKGKRVEKDNDHPYKAIHVWPDFRTLIRIHESIKIDKNYIPEKDVEDHYKINSENIYDYKAICDTSSSYDFKGLILSEELRNRYDVFADDLGIIGKYTNPYNRFAYLVILGYKEACCNAIYLVDRKPDGEIINWVGIWGAGGDGGDYFYNQLIKKNDGEYIDYDSSFYHQYTEPLDSIFLTAYSTYSIKFEKNGRIKNTKISGRSYYEKGQPILLRTQKPE